MSFTDAEKTDVRRFCGYGAFGQQYTPASGYRFSTQYGALEYKLNNCSTAEESIVRTTYLTNLYTLETAIVGASANLDTDEAAVWKHNKNEIADRERLFDNWRSRFCQFLGVSTGPGLGDGGIRIIV